MQRSERFGRTWRQGGQESAGWANLGIALRDAGDPRGAISMFDRALDLDPYLKNAHSERWPGISSKPATRRWLCRNSTGRFSLSPSQRSVTPIGAWFITSGGVICWPGQDYDKALSLDPRSPVLLSNRGENYLDSGQYQRAIEDFNQAIALDPDFAPPYINRAVAYYFLKRYDEAWAGVRQFRQRGGQPKQRFLDLLGQASGRSQ